jgi:hypothetical protein
LFWAFKDDSKTSKDRWNSQNVSSPHPPAESIEALIGIRVEPNSPWELASGMAQEGRKERVDSLSRAGVRARDRHLGRAASLFRQVSVYDFMNIRYTTSSWNRNVTRKGDFREEEA